MSKWISVKDKLPDNDQLVLTLNKQGIPRAGIFKIISRYEHYFVNARCVISILTNITHWKPLPEVSI